VNQLQFFHTRYQLECRFQALTNRHVYEEALIAFTAANLAAVAHAARDGLL